MEADVRILGSVEVAVDGESVRLGPQLRRMLALLAVHSDTVVSSDLIADTLWPDELRDAKAVRTYVARLRQGLGDDDGTVVRTKSPGYLLALGSSVHVDARRFEEAVVEAREHADAVGRVALLDEALAAWTGPALAEFADEEWARLEALRLDQFRVQVLEERFDAALDAGLHASSVSELERLVREHPTRERFWGQLMLALHRSGRQADALRAFQAHREAMADAGLDPAAELKLLDERIARDDPLLGLESEPDRIRGYVKGERLGEGAFSVVWRALQPTVERDVAIKQVKAELANRPEFIRAFEREAQLVATLEHPRIVPLYDYWREVGAAYLVMRYLRGGTLADAIPRAGAELDLVTTVARHVGEALETAHNRDIVHRDIKPANIFLDEDGNAYLGDFGIAIGGVADDHRDILSYSSPAYASPEQHRQEPASPASDLFCLAVSLYEALTGELALDENGHARAPLPSVTDLRPEIPSTLSDVLTRATAVDPAGRFPSVADFVQAFVEAVGGEPRTVSASGATELAAPIEANPYRGLAAFAEADAAHFFGRHRLVRDLLDRLSGEGSGRLVAVVGPSGSGKSSAVRAGLLPAVRRGAVEGSNRWFTATMVPGVSPFEELEVALSHLETETHPGLGEILRGDDRGIARAVKLTLPDDGSELLLILDQFEELYTLSADHGERDRFAAALASAVSDPNSRLRVVMTIRADFWDRPLRDPQLASLVEAASVHVVPMTPEELEEAIVEPARRAGCVFESGLVARIGADVAGQPGALPLLQYGLTELFERRDGNRLTTSAYTAMGGVSGAIAQRAESEYARLGEEPRRAARRLLGRLVTLGEGTEDTRRRLLRGELVTDEHAEAVVTAFGAARLLSFDRDDTSREPTVEIAHEALIREWPRFRAWLDEDRADMQLERHLERATRDWVEAGRPEAELYRGGRLESALEWVETRPLAPDGAEHEFISASRARAEAEQRRERRRVRRLRGLLVVVGVALVLALVAGFVANEQRAEAEDQQAEAERQTELADANASEAERARSEAEQVGFDASVARSEAEQARREADLGRLVAEATAIASAGENPRLAMLLAAEAFARDPGPQSLDALQRALIRQDGLLGYMGGGSAYTRDGLAFDDAGRLVARTVTSLEIWEVEQRSVTTIELGAGERLSLVGDKAYTLVAGELAVIDLSTETVEEGLAAESDIVAFDLSTDGSLIAVGLDDGRVELAEAAAWENRRLVASTEGRPVDIGFSPDAGMIGATDASADHYLWNISESEPEPEPELESEGEGSELGGPGLLALPVQGERGSSEQRAGTGEAGVVTWLNDGSVMFAGFAESYVFLRDGELLGNLVGLSGIEGQVVVDEDHLVSWSFTGGSGVVRIGEDVQGGFQPVRSLDGRDGVVVANAVLPGVLIASATANGISLWSLDGTQTLAQAVPIEGSTGGWLDADGSTLLSMAWLGGQYRFWDLASKADVTPELAPSSMQLYVPNGDLVTWDGTDARTRVYDGQTFEPLGAEVPFDFWNGFEVSPDRRFTAWGQPGKVTLRDLETGETVRELVSPNTTDSVQAPSPVRFSRDGSRILGVWASGSGSVAVWDVETGELIRLIEPVGGSDSSTAAFSRSGDLVAVADTGGVINFYDTVTWEPSGDVIVDAPDNVFSFVAWDGMRFSEDDRYLAVGSATGARLFDVGARRPIGGIWPNDSGTSGSLQATLAPSGRQAVTGIGQNLLVWNLDPDSWPEIACRVAGRSLTAEEWAEFVGDEPYDPVCA